MNFFVVMSQMQIAYSRMMLSGAQMVFQAMSNFDGCPLSTLAAKTIIPEYQRQLDSVEKELVRQVQKP